MKTSWLNGPVVLGILRQLLTAVGSAVSAAGLLTSDDTNTAIGLIMGVVGLGFSIAANRNHAIAKTAIENEGKEVAKPGSLATSHLQDKLIGLAPFKK